MGFYAGAWVPESRQRCSGKSGKKGNFLLFFSISPLFLCPALYNDLLKSIGRLRTNNDIGRWQIFLLVPAVYCGAWLCAIVRGGEVHGRLIPIWGINDLLCGLQAPRKIPLSEVDQTPGMNGWLNWRRYFFSPRNPCLAENWHSWRAWRTEPKRVHWSGRLIGCTMRVDVPFGSRRWRADFS
jgi:hypothetical protein